MTAPIMGTLRVTMRSDWHVGTGAGRPGDLDRLVARDRDGLPYISAKTLVGMWRDGCERIAYGLDGGIRDDWCKWLDEIFGDEPSRQPSGPAPAAPVGAALSPRPAHLPQQLRAALCLSSNPNSGARQRRERLRTGLTFAKPGVRISPSTGRAQDDFLRMEEMARGGMTLVAPFELRATSRSGLLWAPAQRGAIEALLVAGASEVERLGGKRRRGAGGCRMEVAGLMPFNASLLNVLKKAAPAISKPQQKQPLAAAAPNAGRGWRTLPIAIDLLTPVVAADATIGNVVESLDYVPGSLLLPVIAAALRAGGIDDPAPEIAAGNIVVLPATVEIEQARGLPVPRALHVPKRVDGLSGARNRMLEPDDPGEPRQARRDGYVVSAAADRPIPYSQVHLAVTTHGTIAEREQRPTVAVGGVFSYEAIPAGTRLRSEIRLRRGLAVRLRAGWEKGLGQGRIGRSKKDDYGLVQICAAGPWRDQPEADSDRLGHRDGGQELLIWVLSDLLLRGDALRPRFDLDNLAAELGEKFGIHKCRIILGEAEGAGLLAHDLRLRRYDGWQAQWGLPRPSLVGLRAGSCVRVVVTGQPVSAERLAEIEVEGLGERRAEGFGQVRFNDPLLTRTSAGRRTEAPKATRVSQDAPFPPATIRPGTDEYETAWLIERAAWRKTIAEEAIALGLCEDRRMAVFGLAGNKPGPSQLGGLRSHLGGLGQDNDPRELLAWLAQVKDKRADRWPQNCIERIQKLLSDRAAIWDHLAVEAKIDPLTENGAQKLKQDLWGEAVAAAIGAAMRAHVFAQRSARAMEPANA